MNEQDIDLYLRAKNPRNIGNIAINIALVSTGLALISLFVPGFSEFAKYLLLLAFIVGTSTYGTGHRSYVSRKEILALIERNINADPKLISIVSGRQAQNHRVQKN